MVSVLFWDPIFSSGEGCGEGSPCQEPEDVSKEAGGIEPCAGGITGEVDRLSLRPPNVAP